MGPAHLLERPPQVLGRDPLRAKGGAGRSPLFLDQGQQQVLGGDIGIAHLPGIFLGPVEHPVQLPTEAGLRAGALLPREPADLTLHLVGQTADVHPGLLQQRLHHPLGLLNQGQEQVSVVDDWVAQAARLPGRIAERLLGLDGHPIRSDHS